MKKIIIIGHKNPDTDSIVSSSIAEHYFKNILKIDAKACCAGELNNETKFVLNQFGVQAPQLLKTLKSDDKIILVDHNEFGQAIDGLQVGHIERIVDHHKLTMQTEQPIFNYCQILPHQFLQQLRHSFS